MGNIAREKQIFISIHIIATKIEKYTITEGEVRSEIRLEWCVPARTAQLHLARPGLQNDEIRRREEKPNTRIEHFKKQCDVEHHLYLLARDLPAAALSLDKSICFKHLTQKMRFASALELLLPYHQPMKYPSHSFAAIDAQNTLHIR